MTPEDPVLLVSLHAVASATPSNSRNNFRLMFKPPLMTFYYQLAGWPVRHLSLKFPGFDSDASRISHGGCTIKAK